jgi:hypothetical protein
MEMLDIAGDDPAYEEALLRAIWVDGYTVEVREAALVRMEQRDLEALKRTIRQKLPQLGAPRWRDRLCEIVAERGWVDLSPALVSSWARPVSGVDDADRAEYVALARLHGPDRVVNLVFDEMLAADQPWQSGFRHRCWALLHRLGERERLIRLIESADVAPEDAMLVDLRAAADDLGIVPYNREEILWIRKLREPDRAEFWSQAVTALSGVSRDRRLSLELRDVPVVVAASLHAPELLDQPEAVLYARVEERLRGQRHWAPESRVDAPSPQGMQRLRDVRDKLTWGDLLAMLMATEALRVPQVVDHLFDYADRDRADRTTEYGGVIDLDGHGRFQVLEFPPRIRHHDQKFITSQEMLDAAYTALFHFHFHVQRPRNEAFAGPGLGDSRYADALRANCLVITSVGKDRLNVDFYRHLDVEVDLGSIERPGS